MAWTLELHGSDALEAPNEAVLGAVTGLRTRVREALEALAASTPDFLERSVPGRFEAWKALGEKQRNLLLDLTLQAVLAAPEYGGNKDTRGWQAIGFPGVGLAVGEKSDEEANN